MYDVKPITSPKNYDCGPTCLKMLLDYYGIEVDLDTLIKECNVRIIGCSAKDINVAGRKHGLDMQAWDIPANEVVRVDRPSIVWWRFDHFAVCCGMDDEGKVVICNPDMGRYRMSEGTFKAFYSGIALFNGAPQDVTPA